MKKTFSFLVTLLLLSISLFGHEFKNFSKNGVDYTWDEKNLYNDALGVYLAAFRKLYTELEIADREEHFKSAMKHELELAQKNPDAIHWLIAKKDDKLVGVAIFELFKYPDIYVREVAVLPDYQHQGIGTELTFAICKDLPELKKILIVTRKVNKAAEAFYDALGFKHSNFCHSEYDPNRYIGMEWSSTTQ